MPTPNKELHFHSRHLPSPTRAYVAWLDVMGVQAVMGRSLPVAANYVFKLHAAVNKEHVEEVVLYPVMDGVYIACRSGKRLLPFLARVFSRLAREFVSTERLDHRFVVRGGLAYGDIIHGSDVPDEASEDLARNARYRDALLLGLPMVQAHLGERNAPPFGIYIDESARTNAPESHSPLHHAWWPWFARDQIELAGTLGKELEAYYIWCEERAGAIDYKPERIASHRVMASQYLRYGGAI